MRVTAMMTTSTTRALAALFRTPVHEIIQQIESQLSG